MIELMQGRVLVASLGLRCRFPSWINLLVRIGRYLLWSVETDKNIKQKSLHHLSKTFKLSKYLGISVLFKALAPKGHLCAPFHSKNFCFTPFQNEMRAIWKPKLPYLYSKLQCYSPEVHPEITQYWYWITDLHIMFQVFLKDVIFF